MKKGKVLVTGAGGFNGRYILELLIKNGYDVRATDLESGERTAPKDYYKNLGVEFIPSDLTKVETLESVLDGISYVMHTASLFDYSAPLELNRKINVEGARNLCEIAKKVGIKKFILWSTIGVYGFQKKSPVSEESPPNPGNAYEISKLEQENVVFEYSKNGYFSVVAMRPAPVYGPRNRYGFIDIIKLCCIPPKIPVPTKLKVRLPSVSVKDVANAGLFLLEAPDEDTDGEIFNVIDDSNILMPEFLAYIAGLLGRETIYINIPIHKPTIMQLGYFTADLSQFISKHITHKRPLFEKATVNYIAYDYIYSNEKLKSIGYKFIYPDCRVGLIEVIDWIKTENFEPIKPWKK